MQQELRASDITPDFVAKSSHRIGGKAENKGLFGVALRAVEFQADLAGLTNRNNNQQSNSTIHNHLHLEMPPEQLQETTEAITQRILNANRGQDSV